MVGTEILTIAIPTYNRNEKLKHQIERLIPQLTDKVKLVIRDNASLIDIRETLKSVPLDKVQLIRNAYNIGAGGNICRCVEECDTKWLWILSDDDLVTNDAVNTVLSKLHNLGEQTVFVNFENNQSLETKGFNAFCNAFNPDIFIKSFWISACVYNIDLLKRHIRFYYENMSTMIGALIMLLKYIETNDTSKCLFVDSKLIIDAGNDISWDKDLYIKRSILVLDYFLGENLKQIKKTVVKNMLDVNASFFLLMKLKKRKRMELFNMFMILIARNGLQSILRYNKYFLLKTFIILTLPNFILSRLTDK